MENLYIHDEQTHNYRAPREILPFVIGLLKPASILDVGCGIGTWLKVAKDLAVKEVLGIDGSYVNKDMLKIAPEEFQSEDLRHPFNLQKKFDLVISLEVAEHIPSENASDFITSLVQHGDHILFSAAIPGQGGQNHLNEQWPAYWAAIFKAHGYHAFDIVRKEFWNNEHVDYWYKQNTILYSKAGSIAGRQPEQSVQPLVHPELFAILQKEKSDIITRAVAAVPQKVEISGKQALSFLIKAFRQKITGKK